MKWVYIGETFPQKIPAYKTRFVFLDEGGAVHIGYVDLEELYDDFYDLETEMFEANGKLTIYGSGYVVDNGLSFKDWSDLGCIAWTYITAPSYIATQCASELSSDQSYTVPP